MRMRLTDPAGSSSSPRRGLKGLFTKKRQKTGDTGNGPSKAEPAEVLTAIMRRANSGLIAVAIISCVVNLLSFTGPIYVVQIYDRVLSGRSSETLVGLLIIVTILNGFSSVFELLERRALAALGGAVEHNLEELAFSAHSAISQQGIPIGAAPRQDPMRALDQIRWFITSRSGIAGLFDAPWCLAFVLVLGLLHLWMGVLALVSSVTVAALSWRMVSCQNKIDSAATIAKRTTSNHSDYSGGLISAKGLSEVFKKQWLRMRARGRGATWIADDAMRVHQALAGFVSACSTTGMMGLAAYLTVRQETTAGAILMSSVMLRPTLRIAQGIPPALIALRRSRLAKEALRQYFEQPSNSFSILPNIAASTLLRVTNLSVEASVGSQRILDNVSFAVSAGTVVCIRGHSGAGKSTLCRVIAGASRQSQGKVCLNDLPMDRIKSSVRQAFVGYLPENAELVRTSLAANISRAKPSPSQEEIRAVARKFDVDSYILSLPRGYSTIVGDDPLPLSRGLQQKIALAAAFYGDPRVLVLDHPLAYCDEHSRRAVCDEVQRLRGNSGIIIIAAYTDEELAMADIVLTLGQGRIINTKSDQSDQDLIMHEPRLAVVRDA